MEKAKRLLGPDLIRCAAFFAVVSVHFFLNSGFYDVEIHGRGMIPAACAKNLMMTCVPLFLLLTGYLMRPKRLSKGYYAKCLRAVGTYVLVSAAMYGAELAQGRAEWTIDSFLWPLLDFARPRYGWYIEMYIGLYLLIPFLNRLYDAAGEKQLHLVGTLLAMVTLPASVNVWHKCLPAWWSNLYPVMYYLLGCWIRDHQPKINRLLNLAMIFGLAAVFGYAEYRINYGETFNQQPWAGYYSLSAVVLSMLIFLLLYNVEGTFLPKWIRSGVGLISRLTLGAYLISQLFDEIFYAQLAARLPETAQRIGMNGYLSVVPKVMLCSLAAAGGIELVYTLLVRATAAAGRKG